MRLVFISDTHLRHDFKCPEGDILVHCGDMTMSGSLQEITRATKWLKGLYIGHGFRDCVAVPGNHDWLEERDPNMMSLLMEEAGITYLNHRPAEVQGLKFFGSGYTPRFYDWALNVDRGPKLAALWAQIPDDTQILVTHGPPKGRLDECQEADEDSYSTTWGAVKYKTVNVGCADLRDRIRDLSALRVHAFGHIHRPGMIVGADGVTYINASTCNEQYQAVHAPQVLELP